VGPLSIAEIHVERPNHMNNKDQIQKLQKLISEIEGQTILFDFDNWPKYQQTCVEWGDKVAPFLGTGERNKFNHELDKIRALLPSEPFLDSYRTGAPKQGAFNKMRGIAKQRLQELETDLTLQNGTQPADNKPPDSSWYQKPIGYVWLSALAAVLAVLIVYLIKKHLGILL
jgi:hypothetical protein